MALFWSILLTFYTRRQNGLLHVTDKAATAGNFATTAAGSLSSSNFNSARRHRRLPSSHLKQAIRDFKIRRLRTTTTDKRATAHVQNHVTVHFSRVVQRLRWVGELFCVVATTEKILLAFCRLGNSRISSFRKKAFNSPALSEREAKYVSFV